MIQIFSILCCVSLLFSEEIVWEYDADLFMGSQTETGETVRKFIGNVRIWQDSLTIYADSVSHFPHQNTHLIEGNVKMVDITDTLTCETLLFVSDSTEYLKASQQVRFIQENQQLDCDSLVYWTQIDSGFAIGNVKLNQTENMLIADQFNYWKTDGFRGSSFIANGNAKMKGDYQTISADFIEYKDETQFMLMNGNAVLQDTSHIILGEIVQVQYEDSLIDNIQVLKNAVLWNDHSAKPTQSSSYQLFRDEMVSNNMTAFFEDGEIDRLELTGMASAELNVVDDTLLIGLNATSGDTISMHFENGNANRIQVFGGARGQFEPEGNSTKVDTTVIYQAEYIDYHVNDEVSYLNDNAKVEYQDMVLTSGHIFVDWNTNILEAELREDNYPTIDTNTGEPMTGEAMVFNLITNHGRITKGRTGFNSGFYHGKEIFRDEPEMYHVNHSKYTSCDRENPHFYFGSRFMKMLPNDKVVAKPLILYVFDIPIIGFPLAVFPNKGGKRRSGWIMPSFGTHSRWGSYLQKLGYFWAPNDYMDVKFISNFYDKKGIELRTYGNYKKRYRFNGSISSTFHRNLNDDITEDISDIFSDKTTQSWDLHWKHKHTIDPTQYINVDFTYVSSNDFYQETGYNLDSRLKQQINSSAHYFKSWPKNSLSINLSETYNLLSEEDEPYTTVGSTNFFKSRTLPQISFSHSHSKLFGNGDKWYNNIYWRESSSYKRIKKEGFVSYVLNDDTTYAWEDTTYSDQNMVHSFTFTAPQKFFGWLTLNPSVNLKEDWIFKYRQPNIDNSTGLFADLDINNVVDYTETHGFKRRLTGSVSLSTSTKIYGIFPTRIGKLDALRHVITPSLSFSYKPDYSKLHLGYFETDNAGEQFDYFAGSMAGGTSTSEQKNIGISIKNLLQAKVNNGEESFQKIDLLNWNVSTSYNAVEDEYKWSTIRSSINTTLPGGSNLSVSMTHDPYQVDDDFERIPSLAPIPRLTSMDASTNIKLSGSSLIGFVQSESTSNDTLDYEEEEELHYSNQPYEPVLGDGNLWETSLSFRYSLQRENDDWRKTFWMNANMKFRITQNWKLTYTARFDLEEKELVSHSFYFFRPLHCWEFSFKWWPGVGGDTGNGFMLNIYVKNPDLRDVKVESTGGRLFGF